MCQEITDVISEFVSAGKVFTAHDITREARTRTDDNIRHSEVQTELNGQLLNQQIPNYNRDIGNLDIGSGKPQPFVYYPVGKTALDHSKTIIDRVGIAVLDDDNTDSDDEEDGVIHKKVTKELRLEIPTKILSQASKNFSGCYPVRVNGSIFYKRPIKSGRVRVSLGSFGITSQGIVKICVDDNKDIQLDY